MVAVRFRIHNDKRIRHAGVHVPVGIFFKESRQGAGVGIQHVYVAVSRVYGVILFHKDLLYGQFPSDLFKSAVRAVVLVRIVFLQVFP